MILHLRRKMKDDLSQKNTRKYDIFLNLSERMVFSKRAAPEHDLSCIILKDGTFFPKTWYFFLGQEVRDDLSQEIHGNMIFSAYTYRFTNVVSHPSTKKSQRWPSPAKIHLNVIDVLDWHPRKTSRNSLYFQRDLYRRFHVLLSGEKNRKLNM